MAKSTIADRYASHYDALAVLREPGQAAISATAAETAIAIPITKLENCNCIVQYQALTGIDATNNWSFVVSASATLAGTYVAISAAVTTPDGKPNDLAIPINGYTVAKQVPNAAFVRVTATKTGTAGALTYCAYLSPN